MTDTTQFFLTNWVRAGSKTQLVIIHQLRRHSVTIHRTTGMGCWVDLEKLAACTIHGPHLAHQGGSERSAWTWREKGVSVSVRESNWRVCLSRPSQRTPKLSKKWATWLHQTWIYPHVCFYKNRTNLKSSIVENINFANAGGGPSSLWLFIPLETLSLRLCGRFTEACGRIVLLGLNWFRQKKSLSFISIRQRQV